MLSLSLLAACAPTPRDRDPDGRVVVQYWEKWSGREAEAINKIVERFNRSQDRIRVNCLSTSQMERKLLLATAGGNPPDLAGFISHRLVIYSEMGAVIPLDGYMARDGVTSDTYLPSIVENCVYRGHWWGMPSTPATLALHYNKKLFREAGLDPEKPPRTIAELNEYAKKLTKYDDKGNLVQLGFSPLEPGWWNELWPRWFGGELWDGKSRITADSPECVAAFEWIQSFPKQIGTDRIQRFTNLGGNFQSSQNLFIAGKVGMELQGVWMNLFISQYNPTLEWAVAPFPAVREDMRDVTLTECDVVAIPRGARHPDEAWEFVKFLQRQDNMEELNLMQQKFSPLTKVSDDFYRRHPNPYIRIFRKLAESPNARASIRTQVYDELVDEIGPAIDLIWRMEDTPANALRRVTERMQPKLDRAMAEWQRVEKRRLEEWERINAQEGGR